MLFLFTWEEKFLLDQQLEKWKKAFIKKYWANNLYIFGEDNFDPEQIASALAGGWLFDEKKFIVIKWLPKDSFTKIPSSNLEKVEEFLTAHIDQFSEENVIVFVSYKPDKRTKFYKFLSKHPKVEVKEFKLLNSKQLLAYLTKNYPISLKDAEYLIERVGTNLYMLSNELQKILKISPQITKDLIDKYVIKNVQQDAFALLDNLGNTQKALEILGNLEQMGEDFFKVLGLLYWNLKNTILIKEQQALWENSKMIATKLSIHPFVVAKTLKWNYDVEKLKTLFKNLLDLDWKIKTWKVSSELGYLYLKKLLEN